MVTDEREDVTNKGVKMIWEEGKDEWAPYAMAHMEAIRYVTWRPSACMLRCSDRGCACD